MYAFALAIAHIPGVTGHTVLAGYSFLSLTLPFVLLARIKLTPGHVLGVLFLAYACVSLGWSSQPLNGLQSLWHWFILAGSFCLGHKLQDLRPIFAGLGVGLCVSGVVGFFQLLGFEPVDHFAAIWPAVSGLFYNPNALTETAAIVLVGLIVYRLWWLVPGVAATMLMGYGRAGILAFTATAVLSFVPARYRFLGIVTLLGAVVIALQIKGGDRGIGIRLEAIEVALQQVTLLGNGVGSFLIRTSSSVFEHLHNDPLEIVYEFGFGAIPLVLMVASALSREGQAKPIFICFLLESLLSFPTFMPVTGFMAAVVAGHLYRSRIMVWDRSAHRRSSIHARLGSWGYWADGDGGKPVSVRN